MRSFLSLIACLSCVACSSGSPSNSTGGPIGDATFTVDVKLSDAIQTVGIVTWSADVSLDTASIAFGRDQNNFEFEAPVDLAQASYRTLLLGMKQNTTYYFRINASGGGKQYASAVYN